MTVLENKKIVMVLAHPDDEIIFGWPIFQMEGLKKEVLICTSDKHNKERKWCKHRKKPLFEICEHFDVPVTCLDYNSEFYKMNTRDESLTHMYQDVLSHLNKMDYDFVFTHNPMGEYGHLDHTHIFQLLLTHVKCPLLYTDICININWPSFDAIPERYRQMYYTQPVFENMSYNKDVYDYCESVYRNHDVWTWSRPPVERCSLFMLE